VENSLQRTERHRRWIEAQLPGRWSGAEAISWRREEDGYVLEFVVNGTKYRAGFAQEFLEDEGTENQLLNDLGHAQEVRKRPTA
jgi:hypothetical protein